MFLRHWAGLPKDLSHPSTLNGLGFFINDQYEIRSKENPDHYFQFAASKNDRVNMRRGFHFELAIQDEVYDRLQLEGLQRTLLPLGATPNDPHVPVLTNAKPNSNAPTVLILGEPNQAHGMLAFRVANGAGGIEEGSMTRLVRALKEAIFGCRIIIANSGALWWWPEGQRTVTVRQTGGLPIRSLVSRGVRHVKEVNDVKDNEDEKAHLRSVFRDVVGEDDGRLYILGLGMTSETVMHFLDEKQNWEKWGRRVDGMVMTGMPCDVNRLRNEELKELLAKRTRRYVLSSEALDTPLFGPCGNTDLFFETPGMPCYSSSHDWSVEMITVKALPSIVNYLAIIANSADPCLFQNPVIEVAETKKPKVAKEEAAQAAMDALPEEQRPLVQAYPEELLERERAWMRFEEMGELIDEQALQEVGIDGRGSVDCEGGMALGEGIKTASPEKEAIEADAMHSEAFL